MSRTPYLFTAKELDEETGLYYFGARYYDPRTSVWQSPDPILPNYLGGSPAGGAFAPRNLNLYGYAGQNPLRVQDPDGKFLDTILDVGFIIYDLGALAYDEVANGGANRTENLMALGADAAGALVPFATGGGVAVRAGAKVAAHVDDAAHAARLADKGTDAARVAEEGVTHIDEAVDAGKGATEVSGKLDAQGTKRLDEGGSGPDFVVSPGGTAYPVPKNAAGPSDVINPAGKRTGSAFTGGKGGANGQVDTMRIMDPTPPRGKSPGYPNGYIKYENKAGQGVDPYTGRTIPNSQSHYPID